MYINEKEILNMMAHIRYGKKKIKLLRLTRGFMRFKYKESIFWKIRLGVFKNKINKLFIYGED